MLKPSDLYDWRAAIKAVENTLTSTDKRNYVKGNIAYDIDRMIRRVAEDKARYAKYQNIQTTLKVFVLQHYLTGDPLLFNTEEAPLVQASVGRILHFGKGTICEYTKTVLDEPFALLAARNYFEKYDPKFHSGICSLLSSGKNASVFGNQWEMAVLPSLVCAFHDKILSQTALVPSGHHYDAILDSKATIVGYDGHVGLGATHDITMDLAQFLEGHVFNDSRRDGKPVPPFFYPREDISGPDLAFVLHIEHHGYYPVFVQLKLRHNCR